MVSLLMMMQLLLSPGEKAHRHDAGLKIEPITWAVSLGLKVYKEFVNRVSGVSALRITAGIIRSYFSARFETSKRPGMRGPVLILRGGNLDHTDSSSNPGIEAITNPRLSKDVTR
jgi:hypothetical protein